MKKSLTCSLALAALLPLFSASSKAEASYSLQDSVAFYLRMGKEDMTTRRYATAWGYFEKASKIDPKNTDAQLGIVDACLKMNRMAPAIRAMEAVSTLHPNDY